MTGGTGLWGGGGGGKGGAGVVEDWGRRFGGGCGELRGGVLGTEGGGMGYRRVWGMGSYRGMHTMCQLCLLKTKN